MNFIYAFFGAQIIPMLNWLCYLTEKNIDTIILLKDIIKSYCAGDNVHFKEIKSL
jgi:hypothetical protein